MKKLVRVWEGFQRARKREGGFAGKPPMKRVGPGVALPGPRESPPPEGVGCGGHK